MSLPLFKLPCSISNVRQHPKGRFSIMLFYFCLIRRYYYSLDFPCSSVDKESACSAGDWGSIPGSGRPPGEGNGNPLQYSCLENLMDTGAWWATVHEVEKSRTRLND